MQEQENPFQLSGYHGPALFCDRETETRRLAENIRNGINTTLFSIRRMGKTGLIHNAFHFLKAKKQAQCIYLDIYATQSLRDFTNDLGTAILHAFPEKQSIGRKFMDLLKGFRPLISYDALTGQPEVSFDFKEISQYEHSLENLFSFLQDQNTPIALAIDEFQQIALYPEKNTEALLRSIIQRLKKVNFIFSGSSRHMLAEIFSSSKRPFFASTQAMHLSPIPEEKYTAFITRHFNEHKRSISNDSIRFILNWSRLHTYYTQVICNRIFALGMNKVQIKDVELACSDILKEQEAIFFQYRSLLTPIQWELLKAIAKEDKLYKPSSKQFINAHAVGTPANVQRAMEALLTKEMIYREQDAAGNYYRVYDCFLARWMESQK